MLQSQCKKEFLPAQGNCLTSKYYGKEMNKIVLNVVEFYKHRTKVFGSNGIYLINIELGLIR